MTLVLDRYQLEYRKEIVEPILSTVGYGASLCIVGLAGAGKSNLVTFLTQPEVLAHYLPQSLAQETHVLAIQCRPGTQPSAGFYRSLLEELQPVARRVGYALHIPTEGAGIYDVRSAIEYLCETARQRIVVVLDEFECLIQNQPLEFFEELRNLRDAVRTTNRFAYVTVTHRLPHRIVGNQRFESSKLYELLREHIYAFGPYSEADAMAMLNTLAAQQSLTVEAGYLQRIWAAAGGHAAIMSAMFNTIKPNFAVPSPRLAELALEEGAVRQACRQLWIHLHSSERGALRDIMAREMPPPWLLEFLWKRGLITSVQTPYLFAPALAAYIKSMDR